jgi:hypothetical protein
VKLLERAADPPLHTSSYSCTTASNSYKDIQMSLVCSLPSELFNSLLMSWLMGHVDVGRLDSAVCNTEQRKQFLNLVAESDFVLSNSCLSVVKRCTLTRLDVFLTWITKRRVATTQLNMTNSRSIDPSDRLNYLQLNGKRILEVMIRKIAAPLFTARVDNDNLCTRRPDLEVTKTSERYGFPEHTSFISIIASNCPQLRKLYTCHGLIEGDLAALGEGCPQLATVDKMVEDVTDTGLLAIAQNGALVTLCLIGCFNLTDEGIEATAAFCPHLESVDLNGCALLTDGALVAVGQHCHNLRELAILDSNATWVGLDAIAAGCPLLEALYASECAVGRAIEATARGCPLLRILDVTDVEVPTAAVLALAERCPLLEELGLCRCANVGDDEIAALVHGCPALRKLNIAGTAVTEDGLCEIRDHCKELQRITLSEGMYYNVRNDVHRFPATVEVRWLYH